MRRADQEERLPTRNAGPPRRFRFGLRYVF